MEEIFYKIGDNYNIKKNKFMNFKLIKFYKKRLYKPLKFIASAISWSVFAILLVCAAFLIYYYASLQNYAKKGAGYEPDFYLYTIISASMYPTIEVYDVILVKRIEEASAVKVGDIISYNSSAFIYGDTINVTHRVIEISKEGDKYSYTTKGDNNLSKDSTAVNFNQIDGKVIFKIPQLGRLQFFIASKIGWFVAVVLPAMFIIVKYIIGLLNIPALFKRNNKDTLLFPLYKNQKKLTYKEKKKTKTN